MEEFVREVLSRYTSFVSERQLYERWLDMRENSDVRDALVMTENENYNDSELVQSAERRRAFRN